MIVSKSRDFYQSTDGALAENRDLEAVTADLGALDSRVQHALNATPKHVILTSDDEELRVLCRRCDEVAQQLLHRLRKLIVQPGNLRQWKSIRNALKSVWSKSEIDALAERLDGYRKQLNTRFLVDLREALNSARLENNEEFLKLHKGSDQSDSKILDALLEHRIELTKGMESQTGNLYRVIVQESDKTQQILAQVTALLQAQKSSVTPAAPQDDESVHVQHNSSSDIQQAAREADLPRLRALLTLPGANAGVRDECGQTPIYLAASRGHFDVVRLLFRMHPASCQWEDYEGRTPLHAAVMGNSYRVTRFLLRKFADRNERDDNGKTPLDYAKDDLIFLWMFKHGPNLESCNLKNQNTILISTSIRGDIPAIQSLIAEGATIEARNRRSNTALHEACIMGHLDVIKVLISHGANVNTRGTSGWPVLSDCVRANREAAVRILLDSGDVDLEATPEVGPQTALAEAITLHHSSIARLLVKHSANVNVTDGQSRRFPILCLAVMLTKDTDDVDMVRLLLDHGVDIEAASIGSWTALNEAVVHQDWSAARLLVERGANTNKRDGDHYPPLCRLAQKSNNVAMARVLLDYGADIESTNWTDGRLCRKQSDTSIIRWWPF